MIARQKEQAEEAKKALEDALANKFKPNRRQSNAMAQSLKRTLTKKS